MAKIKNKPVKFKQKQLKKDTPAKVVQKKQKGKEFPKNSRLITEKVIFKKKTNFLKFVLPVLYIILLCLLTVIGVDVYKNARIYLDLTSEKGQITKDIRELQDKIGKYPSFKEGYLKLAILEYRLGKFEESRKYIREALNLDPNFKDAEEFAKIVGEKY